MITENESPPQWALDEAVKRLNEAVGREFYEPADVAVLVLARHIAKHEQPPVDPDAEALRRIFRVWDAYWTEERLRDNRQFTAALAQYKKEIGR